MISPALAVCYTTYKSRGLTGVLFGSLFCFARERKRTLKADMTEISRRVRADIKLKRGRIYARCIIHSAERIISSRSTSFRVIEGWTSRFRCKSIRREKQRKKKTVSLPSRLLRSSGEEAPFDDVAEAKNHMPKILLAAYVEGERYIRRTTLAINLAHL